MTTPDAFTPPPAAGSPVEPPGGVPPVPPVPPAPPPVAPRPVGAPHQPLAGLVAGVVLVVIGSLFLLGRVANIVLGPDAWPLWIIVPGIAMFAASLAIPPRGGVGLAIPGAIVTIVGLVLWVQATYDLYATWAYAWALVAPTGPGVGMLVYGFVRGERAMAGEGLRMMLVGLGLFLGFALFFEGVIGLSGDRVAGLEQVLPYVVIGLGVLLVVLSLTGRRKAPSRT
jgi:hypothetical protein